jgi:serine/threonine-protein kinase
MFWSLTALVAFLAGLYFADPLDAPDARTKVYLLSAVGLAAMAFIWRVILLRRPVALRTLYRLDLVYSLGIGTSFGASAYLQHDLIPAGYLSVVYTTFTVFARALIVPSSGSRTAVASIITFVPMTISAAALAVQYPQDVPPVVYFVGYMLFCVIAVGLSSYGSNILYGLRRDVSAAEQVGQYTLDRKIGEGGMGAVYLAHHVLLRRDTAIKRILPDRVGADNVERFEREVQHMSQLTHPNTVAVYDYGRSAAGVFYYVMEYLDGTDLEYLVGQFGAQPADRVIPILIQVCGALSEAHQRGIVHRDIKPGNIIVSVRGDIPDVAKVVDFGLVKELSSTDSSGGVMGTPSYVAPESIMAPQSVGPASDIYALGAVGYYLLTGRRVFQGRTAVEICVQHVTASPTPPSSYNAGISAELEAILLRCLAKTPEDRPSARELAQLLRALPISSDWTEQRASSWWLEFKSRAPRRFVDAASPTASITVDVGARSLVPEPA